MLLTSHELRYGYWPSRELLGLNPPAISYPEEYVGGDTLNLACTQTNLTASAQRKLVAAWCECLPQLPINTLIFSSKVNQALFEAAASNQALEGLFIKWSSIQCIQALADHPHLHALFIGDSPSLTGLTSLARVPRLTHLFLQNVPELAELSFVQGLGGLKELGLSGGSKVIKVPTLEPLASLRQLQMLWLVRIKPEAGGLQDLQPLQALRSLRSNLKPEAKALVALKNALPALQYLEPVW